MIEKRRSLPYTSFATAITPRRQRLPSVQTQEYDVSIPVLDLQETPLQRSPSWSFKKNARQERINDDAIAFAASLNQTS